MPIATLHMPGFLAMNPCVVGAIALGLILGTPTLAMAQSRPHPTLFALDPSAFPPGSRVVRAGVESNRRLLHDDQRHFGVPPSVAGRLTGYYMDAVEGDPTAQPRPYTSYLVSIFHSHYQAERAFELRWYNWFAVDYFTSPSSAPLTVGANGDEALFHSLDPSQPQVSELFFVRGAVLVEVFQGMGNAASTALRLQSFYAIATRLDTLAREHPAGA